MLGVGGVGMSGIHGGRVLRRILVVTPLVGVAVLGRREGTAMMRTYRVREREREEIREFKKGGGEKKRKKKKKGKNR